MTPAQRLQIESSELRERLNGLAGVEELTDEQRAEVDTLTARYRDVEVRMRAAIAAEEPAVETSTTEVDAEHREREELRSRSAFGRFLSAALRGRTVDGAEAEYAAAVGVTEAGHVPLSLFEERQAGEIETRADATTPAPSTVGVNLQTVVPAVFAASVAPRLGITMPSVQSGTHAIPRLTTNTTAGPIAKGGKRESTAAALTVISATPRRISGRLSLTAEDAASVGTASFESALRQNLQAVMGEQYDLQALNGNGTSPNIKGLIPTLTAPTNPTAVADFDTFLATFADAVDGLWASRVADVAMLVNVDSYRLAAKAFRDVGTSNGHRGDISFADYAITHTGGFATNKRMPDIASNIATGIAVRKGRSGLTLAEHPVWDSIAIDDVYSDSSSATRHFSLHVLVGHEVLIVQPGAYSRVAFKVA